MARELDRTSAGSCSATAAVRLAAFVGSLGGGKGTSEAIL